MSYSADEYFSLVYDSLAQSVLTQLDDLTGTELEAAETALFRQAIMESVRATMWLGKTAREEGLNTFDGFLHRILSDAEEQCRMLKAAASEHCEDTLRRMEEAVADAYDEVKHSRAKFRSALSAASGGPAPRSQPAPRRAMYDAEADEEED